MILLQAGPPEFSVWKEVTVFAIFCAIVVIAVIALEFDVKGEQRRERAQKRSDADTELFIQVEEYRNDFPEHGSTSTKTDLRPVTGHSDRNWRHWHDHDGSIGQ